MVQFGDPLGPPVPQKVQGQGAGTFDDLQDQEAGVATGEDGQVNLDPLQP